VLLYNTRLCADGDPYQQVACVAFAFTSLGVRLEELGARLAIIVPAAVALTALQIVVVGTDVPPVSYMVPTTNMMLCAYVAQLAIAVEAVLLYIIWCAPCTQLRGVLCSSCASGSRRPREPWGMSCAAACRLARGRHASGGEHAEAQPLAVDKEAGDHSFSTFNVQHIGAYVNGQQPPRGNPAGVVSSVLHAVNAQVTRACRLAIRGCCSLPRKILRYDDLSIFDTRLGLALLAAYVFSLFLCVFIPYTRARAFERPVDSIVLFDEKQYRSTGGIPPVPMIW
jgi:hypothetical protein